MPVGPKSAREANNNLRVLASEFAKFGASVRWFPEHNSFKKGGQRGRPELGIVSG